MRYIIFFLCMMSSVALQAQNDKGHVKNLTDEFTQKLQERGIRDYSVSQHFCSGRIEMFKIDGKVCTSKDTYIEVYVLWKEDGQSFLKKIDNCGLFHSVILPDNSLYDFFQTNSGVMMTERVKNYRSENYTGTPQSRKNTQPCFRSIHLDDDGKSYGTYFNLFDIGNSSDSGKNLNYEYNQQLKIVQFDALLSEEIGRHQFNRI